MRIFREWILAIALYVALVIDGSLAFYLHQFMSWGNWGASCWLMPIGVMLISLIDDMNGKEFWLALGAGIVADLYTTGIVGIYAVYLPFSCWCCQRVARFLPEMFWSRLIVVLIGISGLDLYSWLILNAVGAISSGTSALVGSLIINLFWTAILTSITYWIWVNLARNYPFLVDVNAYRQ